MRTSPHRRHFGLGGAALFGCVAAVAMILSGCPKHKLKYPSCAGDKDCKTGEKCVDHHCQQCGSDSDCSAGQVCQNGACVARPGWCNSRADCNGKLCKNHKCVACTMDRECGPAFRCTGGTCVSRGTCKVDTDCANDEDCVNGLCEHTGRKPPPKLSCQMQSVYFGFNKYSVPSSARDSLTSTSQCIKKGGTRTVMIIGHTDPRGTEEYNIALSDRRARAVADYLSRLGIDPARFHIVPRGEADATGTTEAAWKKDRRVDFQWQ